MGREDTAAGKMKQIKGKANDVMGAIKGDSGQQLKGKAQKAVGKVQEAMGKASSKPRFFQFTKSCRSKLRFRAGASGAGPSACAGKYLLNKSKRAPRLSVSREIVHLSCAYSPMSYLMFDRLLNGAALWPEAAQAHNDLAKLYEGLVARVGMLPEQREPSI